MAELKIDFTKMLKGFEKTAKERGLVALWWIPLTKRPMTDEEREYYRERSDVEEVMIFDCPLPDDGQEVLVSWGGNVCIDTFVKDYSDGCYFEGVDIDDVQAWMPLPPCYDPTGTERSDKCSKCEYRINPDYTRCHECKAESEVQE